MINTYALYSELSTLEFAKNKLSKIIDNIDDVHFLASIEPDFTSEYSILYILTGGVESIAKAIIDNTSNKTLLVAVQDHNSLPATYELTTYYQTNSKVEMVYISSDNPIDSKNHIKEFKDSINILDKIKSAKYGIVGGISSWLINSENCNFPKEFNIQGVNIEFEELINLFNSCQLSDIESTLKKWHKVYNTNGIDKNELEKSAKIFYALYVICKKYDLSALTVKCFDLLPFSVTACLALAELNDLGITAGCEGDTQALFSLHLLQVLTGQIPWMANISDVNSSESTIQLAHCTVPTTFLQHQTRIKLETHMESNLSLAVCGDVPLEDVTIFRMGNSTNQYSLYEGKVVDTNMGNKKICRTQTVIKINDTNEWHKKLVGNHQIVVLGNHKKKVQSFLKNI